VSRLDLWELTLHGDFEGKCLLTSPDI